MNNGDAGGVDLQPDLASPPPELVPWIARDVWAGLGVFGLWTLIALGFGIGREAFSWKFDIGVFIALWELVLILPAWWFSVRKYHLPWSALGLRKFEFTSLAVGCGLMVLSYCFNFFYSLTSSVLGFRTEIDISGLFNDVSSPWPILFAGVIVAPFVEEVFFRGFVFAGLRGKYGWVPAALISAGLFALVHLQPVSFLPIFLMGMIFAYLYQRSNSIWPGLIMHLTTNTLGLGAAYLLSQASLPPL